MAQDPRPQPSAATGLAGPQLAAGRDLARGVDQLRRATRPEATARALCLFDDDGAETRHRLTEQTLGIWHGAVPGVAARHSATASAPTAPGTPRQACGSTRTSCCSTPTPARSAASWSSDPAIYGPRPRARPQRAPARLDSAPARAASAWSSTTTSTGATTAPLRTPLARHRHLRAARQGLHPAARPGARARCAAPTPGWPSPAVIDYLRDLGVTAVELLPVHQFVTEPRLAARGLTNYWGYNSSASSPRTTPTPPRATAASRSPSSRRWSRPCTRPASR